MLKNKYLLDAVAFDGKWVLLSLYNLLFVYRVSETKIKLHKVIESQSRTHYDEMYLNDDRALCIVDNFDTTFCQIFDTKEWKIQGSYSGIGGYPLFSNNDYMKAKYIYEGKSNQITVFNRVFPEVMMYNANDFTIKDSSRYTLSGVTTIPDTLVEILTRMDQPQYISMLMSGNLKKYVSFIGAYKADTSTYVLFYFMRKNNIGSTYASVLVHELNGWKLSYEHLNLFSPDYNKSVSYRYFFTDFFCERLKMDSTGFCKLLLYPKGLTLGIDTKTHIENFEKADSLSYYVILGRMKL